MSQMEKALERLKSKPKDFKYSEAKRILESFGYKEHNKGKTSGSRVIFYDKNKDSILLHKPHPKDEMKVYAVEQLIDFLSSRGFIV